jgi:hypothetical protein
MRVTENRMLRTQKGDKEEAGEICTVRSSIIHILNEILLRRSNKAG